MKIGILTFHWASNRNFGASLQSYACMKMIEKKDTNVKIIDFNPEKFNIIRKLIARIGGYGFRKYNNKFLKLTNKIRTKKELEKLNEKFDVFIVGSDQVWRVKWWNLEKGMHYFFDFLSENKKKIAYAASFGIDHWEGDEKLTEKIKPLIKNFNHISVREESGINICKKIFEIDNVVCVLDPTLMIDRKDYQPILDDWKDRNHLKKKYIAHMLLDDAKQLRKGSKEIAAYLKADINYIKGKTFKVLGRAVTFYNKVSQWLTYLKDAELVITDSFHCTVFSLIFHKKFIVIANSNRGIARLETLLNKVGLEDRFFTNIAEVLRSGILDKEIDYEEVDKKLEVHRKYSIDFLKKALED
ncbi:polysaccharide pyruvyl transferase family protein [uncultured Fusobacterium sp.]|uniref:polysaccharide pyruvyl transferase family protein n=1 Tax=uncultured Fusobacterium sp. TaxID=159267 RepID=UPI0027DC650E|nr:polysaccharide pyruvyl transferase family protein [uncultured Fusobacterium sp.]